MYKTRRVTAPRRRFFFFFNTQERNTTYEKKIYAQTNAWFLS